jgi:4-hydroxybenzoate polyprenyltransferase
MGYVVGAGSLAGFPWLLWGTLLPLQAALALATTLPDETGDRLGHKRTLAVIWGGGRVRLLMLALLAVALGLWGWLHPLTAPWRLPAWQHTAAGWVAWLGLVALEWRLRSVPVVPTRGLIMFAVGTAAVLLSWLVLVAGDAAALQGLSTRVSSSP